MRRTARRTGRRLTLLAASLTALALASCDQSRSADPAPPTAAATTPDTTDPTPDTTAPVETTAEATVTPTSGPDTTPTTEAPTSVPATTADATTSVPTTSVAPTSTAAAPSVTDAEWQAVGDQLAVRLMFAGDYSASYAVAVDGEVVYTGAIGARVPTPARPNLAVDPDASAGRDAAVAPTDKFRIASISKVIAATVVMQLVEEGLVELDEPVLPDLAADLGVRISDPAVATITIRDLLAHTSGFPVYQSTFFGGGAPTCRDAAERGLNGGLDTPPGTIYRYSNMNFCLLGLLIEQVTGEPFEQVANDRLLTPLGIEGMRLAGTFDAQPGEVQHPSVPGRAYMEALGAAGAWVGSAEDVVRIIDALDPAKPGWHPLPDDVLPYMRLASDGVVYTDLAERWYGLGLIVWADGSWGHTGTIENTHAMVLNRPDGVTWSILVNGEYPGDTTRLRQVFDDSVAAAGISL